MPEAPTSGSERAWAAGRGGKSGLLAGRRGDGPPPLRSSDRGRRGRWRRRRASPMRTSTSGMSRSPTLTVRQSRWPTSTGSWSAIGRSGTTAASPERRGVEPSPPWGPATIVRAADYLQQRPRHVRAPRRSAVSRDDRREPRMGGFRRRRRGYRVTAGDRVPRRIAVDARPRDDDDLAPCRRPPWGSDRTLRGSGARSTGRSTRCASATASARRSPCRNSSAGNGTHSS